MATDGGVTVLESTDGQQLELPTHVAMLSGTVRFILEDAAPAAVIRLPMVSGAALGRVMRYCEALHATRAEDVVQDAWQAIGAPRELHEIFELAEAANYLDVPELMEVACAAGASVLTRCTQQHTLRTLLRSADGCLRLSGEVREAILQQVEATTLRRIAAVGGEWGGAATRIGEDVMWQSTHLNVRQLMGLPRSKEALRARLQACPNEAREPWPTGRDRGRMPLHVATLRGNSVAVSALLSAFPAAATLGDRQGRLPLHLAAKAAGSEAARNAVVAMSELLAAYPEGARVRDKALMLPLHLAIASGAPDAVCAALLAADMPLVRETGAATPHQYSWVRALAEPRCVGAIATVLRPEAQGGYGYGEWALGLAERVQDEWRRKAIDCASDGARAALQAYLSTALPPRPKLSAPNSGGKRAGKKGGKGRDGAAALMAKHGLPTR